LWANTLALALQLHRRQLIRINELNWPEIGKAGITSLVAGLLSHEVARVLLVKQQPDQRLQALGLITVTWAATVAGGLWLTRLRWLPTFAAARQLPFLASRKRRLRS